MSINNFTTARIEDGRLIVEGVTTLQGEKDELPAGATITVAVLSEDLATRVELDVNDPSGSTWIAESSPGEESPWVDHDHVYAVGATTSAPGMRPFVWANPLCIGKPAPA